MVSMFHRLNVQIAKESTTKLLGALEIVGEAMTDLSSLSNGSSFSHETPALAINVTKVDSARFPGSTFGHGEQNVTVRIPLQFPIPYAADVDAQVRAYVASYCCCCVCVFAS